VVNRSMREISAGDGNKSNYVIYGILIEVLSLDDNLTAYYNSTVKGKDPYSINLYETDYTNIDGGYGVFGIQIFSEAMINISYNYVTSFGYRHAYRTR